MILSKSYLFSEKLQIHVYTFGLPVDILLAVSLLAKLMNDISFSKYACNSSSCGLVRIFHTAAFFENNSLQVLVATSLNQLYCEIK